VAGFLDLSTTGAAGNRHLDSGLRKQATPFAMDWRFIRRRTLSAPVLFNSGNEFAVVVEQLLPAYNCAIHFSSTFKSAGLVAICYREWVGRRRAIASEVVLPTFRGAVKPFGLAAVTINLAIRRPKTGFPVFCACFWIGGSPERHGPRLAAIAWCITGRVTPFHKI